MKFYLAHNEIDTFIYNVFLPNQPINTNLPFLEYFDSENLLKARLLELNQIYIPRTYYISYNSTNTFKYGELTDNINIYELPYLEYFATEDDMKSRLTKIINNTQYTTWDSPNVPALHKEYPHLININYKLLQLDNLVGIKRESPISDKGLKGEKKYYKGDVLIWSSEKKYWFQDETISGFIRIIKLYSSAGDVCDTWEVKCDLSDDDKRLFEKRRRELILEYFKGKYYDLFMFLYSEFSKEISDYIMIGGPTLGNVLTDAAINHPKIEVRDVLNTEIPRASGGSTTVLNGVLEELI